MEEKAGLVSMTAEIVAAYVGKNSVSASELTELIHQVYGALQRATGPDGMRAGGPPAVPVKKSVTADYIICLEDGLRFRALKRHLRTKYNLTPQQYREKWSLPPDYPMVAPNYAAQRSRLAKQIGLGRKPRSRRRRA